jgi:hypothetical protein
MVLGIAGAALFRSRSAWSGSVARVDAERRAASALERITAVLADCGGTTITGSLAPPAGASTVTFRERTGWNAGTVVWGPVVSLSWESDPMDPENGADDDRDGLVDEGQVVWQSGTAPDVMRTVLVQDVAGRLEGETGGNGLDDNGNGLVDERGFSLDLDGGRLTVRLTISAVGPDGNRTTQTARSVLRIDD